MKKVNFFAMLAAAALMTGVTGCSNDDNVGEGPGNGANTLMVKLPSNAVGPGSRAVEGKVSTNSETKLDDVTVFLLNGNSVVSNVEFTDIEITNGFKRIEQVSAAINRVIVVANIPSGDVTTLKGYTNATSILNHPYTTASQNVAGEEIDGKVLVGDATTATGTDPDPSSHTGHTYMEADVTLDALTARFEIGAVKKGAGIESIELIGVWINRFYEDGSKVVDNIVNENSVSTYWNTNPSTTTGTSALPPVVAIENIWIAPEYFDDADTAVELAANSKVYGYQVFAGNNIPQLILLVKGEFTADAHNDDNDKYFLGYVTFSKFNDGTRDIESIVANTIYKVGVGLTGIEITSDMITDKPNLGQIDLGINVDITPWTEKNVTPGV